MTQTDTPPGVNTAITSAGIYDEDAAFPFDAPVAPAPSAADEVREVKIRVPRNIPDNVVKNAWQVGMGTVQRLSLGMVVIAFPSVGKTPDGKLVNTIGKFEMVVAKAEDVQRLLTLADKINKINLAMSQAGINPANALAASIEGKQAKDEALRQSMQEADGLVPLIVAGHRHQAGKGKIEIARH